jgi:uncharacterized protein (TIRG00374 family)
VKQKIKNILKVFVFASIGIILFYLVYKDFDFNLIIKEISVLNWFWIILMLLIGLISHIARTIRWQMMLDDEKYKSRFSITFLAILNGYFANIAIPRLGEVTRCAIVSKYDKMSFSKVLGTMVSERVIDVVVLLLFTILAVSLQYPQLLSFVESTPGLAKNMKFLISPYFWIFLIFIFFAAILFFYFLIKGRFNRYSIALKVLKFFKGFWSGIISLKNLKRPIYYVFLSLFIWACYFLMMYVGFFAFPGLSHLSIEAALFLFVAGSFGMVAPAPNGMGAYHFMIIQSLTIYGIEYSSAASFAFIYHTIMTIELILLGLISFILLPLFKEKK